MKFGNIVRCRINYVWVLRVPMEMLELHLGRVFSEDYDLQLNTQNAVDYESTRAAPKAKPKDIPNVM